MLDIFFAAHTLLLSQELPDTSVANLLKESYPHLISHAQSIYALAFPDSDSFPPLGSTNLTASFYSLLPRLPFSRMASRSVRTSRENEEAKFARWRWALYGGAIFVTTTYIYAIGMVPAFFKIYAQLQAAGEEEEFEYEKEDEEDD